MNVKTLLNRCHPLKSFVYGKVSLGGNCLHVQIRSRKGSKGTCSQCMRRGTTYDTSRAPRSFQFVPLWGYVVLLWYCTRRIDCRRCGVTVELLPWAEGKNERALANRWSRGHEK